ncbi:hypothetical protein JS531_05570 [Bifidobacterium sp. CP2]|uniref:hypothetical protein n=1 Tax=unclassified Bifidobacterium TaxID=2608897 RepID=UPI00112CFB00|nr:MULTISPECIES: hypothetical protein [unclassified Bifidobacterium]MBT1181441.1 hypothetical protein [Bifidobacterium sp. CP2]
MSYKQDCIPARVTVIVCESPENQGFEGKSYITVSPYLDESVSRADRLRRAVAAHPAGGERR